METPKKKCSSETHQDKEAVSYCSKCDIYMCKKCQIFHSELFTSKHSSSIFEESKFSNLNESNELPCLDDLQLNEDIKYLKNYSNKLKDINDKLNLELEKINKIKEDSIIKTQKYFTQLRNELNKIEDEILLEIDKQYEKVPLNEKIKNNYLLLNKIKLALNKNNFNLKSLVNECKNTPLNNNDIKNDNLKFDYLIPEEKEIIDIDEKIRNLFKPSEPIFCSSIIKNDLKKLNLLNNWVKEKMEKNSLKYELIYKMSENGSKCKTFHKYCDNQGPTLTIIKTTSNRIFGGFNPFKWISSSDNEYKDYSKKRFLFSMNKMKKYELLNSSKRAIYTNKYDGPHFGNADIEFGDDLKKGKSAASGTFLPPNKLELTDGFGESEKFESAEVEIFKVS